MTGYVYVCSLAGFSSVFVIFLMLKALCVYGTRFMSADLLACGRTIFGF